MTISLGNRLSTVAHYVPKEAELGDIGTDHAYLPIYLYEQGVICRAIGVDVHQGPYRSALGAVRERNLQSKINIRLGDGLKPIQAGEVDVLTMAGMGGNTMLEIIQSRPEVIQSVNRLILQPQGAEGNVRLNLLEAGWHLLTEELVEEDGRTYTVIVFVREGGWTFAQLKDKEHQWYESLFRVKKSSSLTGVTDVNEGERAEASRLFWKFGPLIVERQQEMLEPLLTHLIRQLERQIQAMQEAIRPEVKAIILEAEEKIRVVQAIKDGKCKG